MVDRIIGVLKMDVNTFEEIEADQTATTQAAMIVVVVALVNGLFSGLITGSFFGTLISTILSTLIGWVAWSAKPGILRWLWHWSSRSRPMPSVDPC
jgi:hypothetical protein